MTEKLVKIPGPDHPITLSPSQTAVVVMVAGLAIANSRRALVLKEATYPPVFYVPREDVDMRFLEKTTHHSYCPYKGDCSYYSIPIGGERSVNAVWSYENPYPSVMEIKGFLAFYPDRVDNILS